MVWVLTDYSVVQERPSVEFLAMFKTMAGAEAFLARKFGRVDKRKVINAKIAAALRGEGNPNFGGLSELHRMRIALAMRGTRRGGNNPMAGRKHRPMTKMKMALYHRARPKRKWVLDPDGAEHLILASQPVPAGWVMGRRRN